MGDGRGRERGMMLLQVFILRLEVEPNVFFSSQHSSRHPERTKAELNGRRDMEHLPSSPRRRS